MTSSDPGYVEDTIAGVATAPGRGAIGVVRISGPAVGAICRAICGELTAPRVASLRTFADAEGRAIDRGLVLHFPGPHSYTGEDLLELQAHGGPVVLDMLLERALQLGARLARPGEFTERAFLNDKLDLAQAEAVADLIEAGSRQAARAALRSLDGEFSNRVAALVEQLTAVRVYVEAALDFPEEEIDLLGTEELSRRLAALRSALSETEAAARHGQVLRDGFTVVIAGPPNVGKSSLLNRLAERESAIVTDIAGTTRDLLRELIQIDGLPLHLVDTAGLRESLDPVEREGVRRAREQLQQADRVLYLLDASAAQPPGGELPALPQGVPVDYLHNKIDLCDRAPGMEQREGRYHLMLSAKTGAGMALLRQHLKERMVGQEQGQGLFTARRRHLRQLQVAGAHLAEAESQWRAGAGELLAEELRQAQTALGEITGAVSSDELLGRIFADFCIGK